MTPDATPTPTLPPTEYTLSPGETMVFRSLNQAVANAQLAIYALNMQLEVAQKERDRLEAQFSGSLSFLANSHGMGGANLSPDFTRLTPKGA